MYCFRVRIFYMVYFEPIEISLTKYKNESERKVFFEGNFIFLMKMSYLLFIYLSSLSL